MPITTRGRALLAAGSIATAVAGAGAVVVHAQGGPPPGVPVVIDDGAAPAIPATIAPGPTTFKISTTSKTVDGDSPELTLVSIPAGADPSAIAADIKKNQAMPATIEAALKRDGAAIVGEGSADKGQPRDFTIDLAAGNYLALNTTQDKKLPVTAVTVTGAPNGASVPAAVTTVKMGDYNFNFSGALRRGKTEKITNVGKKVHMLIAFRVADMKTAKKVAKTLKHASNPEKTLGKFVRGEGHAGIGVLSPGGVVYKTVEDAPGAYVAVCFWQSSSKAKAHYMLGMEKPYTVK